MNNYPQAGSPVPKGPSSDAFRKVKWMNRKRCLIAFFTFLLFIAFILFFDYYWAMISRALTNSHSDIDIKEETAMGKTSMYWMTMHARDGVKAKIIGSS
jgi:hypothetical protein